MRPGWTEPGAEQVRELLRRMVGARIAVIGDAILDAYLFGAISRLSPEAPVPVFEAEREDLTLGGAGNVAKCLAALGGEVRLCAVLGDDPEGALFLREAQGLRVDTSGVLTDPERPTTVKRRLVAQRQQLLRLDRERTAPLSPAREADFTARAVAAVEWADAVVLSDYSKGVLSTPVCAAMLKAAGERTVVVDPKGSSWERFRGATLFKPNIRDVRLARNEELTTDEQAARAAGAIRQELGFRHVLITRGPRGMTLASEAPPGDEGVLQLHSRPREVFDVAGAGDVVAATVTLALAAGAPAPEAAWLANLTAGVKVGKFGTASVSDQEILEHLGDSVWGLERKVLTRAQAVEQVAQWRQRGRRVVFTNGCFDILHFGHVSYLERSRRLGDALVVGLNTDASIRRLKGPGRPMQSEHDRARILAAQSCVDAVVLFDEDTPVDLLRALKPDILCKGGDYKVKENVVGWEVVESWGGQIELVELEPGRSTTNLIEKSRKEIVD